MNTYLHHVFTYFETVIHPAAGKLAMDKNRKRATTVPLQPKASPDCLNIREMVRKQDSFRRNPAP